MKYLAEFAKRPITVFMANIIVLAVLAYSVMSVVLDHKRLNEENHRLLLENKEAVERLSKCLPEQQQ